ncbi:hypothetical protein D3C87_1626900 [compost metagenome]
MPRAGGKSGTFGERDQHANGGDRHRIGGGFRQGPHHRPADESRRPQTAEKTGPCPKRECCRQDQPQPVPAKIGKQQTGLTGESENRAIGDIGPFRDRKGDGIAERQNRIKRGYWYGIQQLLQEISQSVLPIAL